MWKWTKQLFRLAYQWLYSWKYRGIRVFPYRGGWVINAKNDKLTAFFGTEQDVLNTIDYAHYIGGTFGGKVLKPFDGGEPYIIWFEDGRWHREYAMTSHHGMLDN